MLGRFFTKFTEKPGQKATKKDGKPKADKFTAWLEQNPNGTFQQFYVDSVAGALAGEKDHASLGPTPTARALNRARTTVSRWIGNGIRPDDVVVDYGCGTLRLGRLLIDYLEPDRYIGLDIDDRVIAAGRSHLPDDLIATKRPVLEVISPNSLQRTAARQPKWVCSKGVLQHVPPAQIDKFFEDISRLVSTGATGWIECQTRSASEQLSYKTWAHCLDDLQKSAARFGMSLVRVKFNERPVLVLSAAK